MSAQPTSKVVYRQLGKSGLRVSVPILGAMSFGTREYNKWSLPEDEALPIIKYAWDLGINTIDTANIYANGDSERIVGQFLKKYSIPRHEVVIATKIMGLVGKEPGLKTMAFPNLENTRDYVNQSGLSRAAIFNAVDACLERLDTPYIDLLQIHRFDPKTTAEETMKALHDLVEAGKVRYLGASSMRTWQFAHLNEVARKNGWTTFISMQPEYSLIYREEEREMFGYCNFHGIGIIPWAPLASGSLARPFGEDTSRSITYKGTPWEKKFTQSDQTIITRVQELASKYNVAMAQIALAWVQTKVSSPIVGVSSEKRVLEAITEGVVSLTPEEIKYLEEPYEPRPVRGHA